MAVARDCRACRVASRTAGAPLKSVLVTGGTGSFGQAFVRRCLEQGVERVVVFSRDELKQHDMRLAIPDERVRWFIGDVRDKERLRRAMAGVEVVVHAAAMKQVPACEANPMEAIATNVDGARNVIDAALDTGVRKVLALSTDKAVDPVNLYGATKLCAEKLFVDANVYSGAAGTRFACTRYGNVVSSRGSVLPLWLAEHGRGEPLRVTDPAMTRFVLTLEHGVDIVADALRDMRGGEVFVPDLPAVDLYTLARAVGGRSYPIVETGRRPGEKQHELLISENEAHRTRDEGDRFVVYRWLGEGGMAGEVSSATARRLDVAAFRRLAGLDDTAEVAA